MVLLCRAAVCSSVEASPCSLMGFDRLSLVVMVGRVGVLAATGRSAASGRPGAPPTATGGRP